MSEQQDIFGITRTVIKPRYALITPDSFVPSFIPGWEDAECNIVISHRLGAGINQWLARIPKGIRCPLVTQDKSFFIYVLGGKVSISRSDLERGGFIYLPPETTTSVMALEDQSRILVFEKRYEHLEGHAAPIMVRGHESEVQSEPFLGHEDARLQTLLPETQDFDMAVNIFVYDPGATLPFVETHIMEHGMMMLKGQGVYRFQDDYYPVAQGDVIWMAPWCPQWYVSMGRETSSYIYYKDVNRHPSPDGR